MVNHFLSRKNISYKEINILVANVPIMCIIVIVATLAASEGSCYDGTDFKRCSK